MRLGFIVTGLLLLVLTSVSTGQEATVVYRAEVNVVQLNYMFSGPKGPILGLTSANFLVLIDKKVSVPVTVVPDPTPGGYHVNFSPPDNLRDGEKHRVDVTVLDVLPKVRPWKMKASQVLFSKPRQH